MQYVKGESIDDGEKREHKYVKKYISYNPFKTLDQLGKLYLQYERIDIYSEISPANYIFLKNIYDNFDNINIVRKNAIKIYELGGNQALVMSFYGLMYQFVDNTQAWHLFKGYVDEEYNGVGDYVS